MKRYRTRLRLIALVLAAAFGAQETGFAAIAGAPAPPSAPQRIVSAAEVAADPSRLEVPVDAAALREAHLGTSGKLIVHIQDAHSSLSGQQNLAKTLDKLIARHGITLVLVEGSTTDVTLDEAKASMPAESWKRVAKRFLTDGAISGEEYLNLTSDHPMKLAGVEDPELYDANVAAYAKLASARGPMLAHLLKAERAIASLKLRIYPKVLVDYEKISSESDAAFASRLEALAAFAPSAPASPELLTLAQIRSLERGIDFARLNAEQEKLLSALSASGENAQVREYLKSFAGAAHLQAAQYARLAKLVQTARRAGVDDAAMPETHKYLSVLKRFAGLRFDALFDEFDAYEESAYRAALSGNAGALKLRAAHRYVKLVGAALRIRMSSAQFDEFTANRPSFDTRGWQAFVNAELAAAGLAAQIVPHDAGLERSLDELGEFYKLVSERDGAFVRRAAETMAAERQDAAFFVAGGYHTQNLTRLWREQGHSYVVLSPIVTEETDTGRYERLLLASASTLRQTGAAEPARAPGAEPPSARRFEEIYGKSSVKSADVLAGIEVLVKAAGSRTTPGGEQGGAGAAQRSEEAAKALASASEELGRARGDEAKLEVLKKLDLAAHVEEGHLSGARADRPRSARDAIAAAEKALETAVTDEQKLDALRPLASFSHRKSVQRFVAEHVPAFEKFSGWTKPYPLYAEFLASFAFDKNGKLRPMTVAKAEFFDSVGRAARSFFHPHDDPWTRPALLYKIARPLAADTEFIEPAEERDRFLHAAADGFYRWYDASAGKVEMNRDAFFRFSNYVNAVKWMYRDLAAKGKAPNPEIFFDPGLLAFVLDIAEGERTALLHFLVEHIKEGRLPVSFIDAKFIGAVDPQAVGNVRLHIDLWTEGKISPAFMDPMWLARFNNRFIAGSVLLQKATVLFKQTGSPAALHRGALAADAASAGTGVRRGHSRNWTTAVRYAAAHDKDLLNAIENALEAAGEETEVDFFPLIDHIRSLRRVSPSLAEQVSGENAEAIRMFTALARQLDPAEAKFPEFAAALAEGVYDNHLAPAGSRPTLAPKAIEYIRGLRQELTDTLGELKEAFLEPATQLAMSEAELTPRSVEAAFEPHNARIFKIVEKLRRVNLETVLIENQYALYVLLNRKDRTADGGLCMQVNGVLGIAFNEAGIPVESHQVFNENKNSIFHQFLSVGPSESVAVDAAFGQFDPVARGRVLAKPFAEHEAASIGAWERAIRIDDVERNGMTQSEMAAEFAEKRKELMLKIARGAVSGSRGGELRRAMFRSLVDVMRSRGYDQRPEYTFMTGGANASVTLDEPILGMLSMFKRRTRVAIDAYGTLTIGQSIVENGTQAFRIEYRFDDDGTELTVHDDDTMQEDVYRDEIRGLHSIGIAPDGGLYGLVTKRFFLTPVEENTKSSLGRNLGDHGPLFDRVSDLPGRLRNPLTLLRYNRKREIERLRITVINGKEPPITPALAEEKKAQPEPAPAPQPKPAAPQKPAPAYDPQAILAIARHDATRLQNPVRFYEWILEREKGIPAEAAAILAWAAVLYGNAAWPLSIYKENLAGSKGAEPVSAAWLALAAASHRSAGMARASYARFAQGAFRDEAAIMAVAASPRFAGQEGWPNLILRSQPAALSALRPPARQLLVLAVTAGYSEEAAAVRFKTEFARRGEELAAALAVLDAAAGSRASAVAALKHSVDEVKDAARRLPRLEKLLPHLEYGDVRKFVQKKLSLIPSKARLKAPVRPAYDSFMNKLALRLGPADVEYYDSIRHFAASEEADREMTKRLFEIEPDNFESTVLRAAKRKKIEPDTLSASIDILLHLRDADRAVAYPFGRIPEIVAFAGQLMRADRLRTSGGLSPLAPLFMSGPVLDSEWRRLEKDPQSMTFHILWHIHRLAVSGSLTDRLLKPEFIAAFSSAAATNRNFFVGPERAGLLSALSRREASLPEAATSAAAIIGIAARSGDQPLEQAYGLWMDQSVRLEAAAPALMSALGELLDLAGYRGVDVTPLYKFDDDQLAFASDALTAYLEALKSAEVDPARLPVASDVEQMILSAGASGARAQADSIIRSINRLFDPASALEEIQALEPYLDDPEIADFVADKYDELSNRIRQADSYALTAKKTMTKLFEKRAQAWTPEAAGLYLRIADGMNDQTVLAATSYAEGAPWQDEMTAYLLTAEPDDLYKTIFARRHGDFMREEISRTVTDAFLTVRDAYELSDGLHALLEFFNYVEGAVYWAEKRPEFLSSDFLKKIAPVIGVGSAKKMLGILEAIREDRWLQGPVSQRLIYNEMTFAPSIEWKNTFQRWAAAVRRDPSKSLLVHPAALNGRVEIHFKNVREAYAQMSRAFLTTDRMWSEWEAFVDWISETHPGTYERFLKIADLAGEEGAVDFYPVQARVEAIPEGPTRDEALATFNEVIDLVLANHAETPDAPPLDYNALVNKTIDDVSSEYGTSGSRAEIEAILSRLESEDNPYTKIIRLSLFGPHLGDPEVRKIVYDEFKKIEPDIKTNLFDSITFWVSLDALYSPLPVDAQTAGLLFRLTEMADEPGGEVAAVKVADFLEQVEPQEIEEAAFAAYGDRELAANIAAITVRARSLEPLSFWKIKRVWKYAASIKAIERSAPAERKQAIGRLLDERLVAGLMQKPADDAFPFAVLDAFAGSVASGALSPKWANFRMLEAIRDVHVDARVRSASLVVEKLVEFESRVAQGRAHALLADPAAVAGFMKNHPLPFIARGLGTGAHTDWMSGGGYSDWIWLVASIGQGHPRAADAMLEAAEFFGEHTELNFYGLSRYSAMFEPAEFAERMTAFAEALNAYVEVLSESPQRPAPDFDYGVQVEKIIRDVFEPGSSPSGSRWGRLSGSAVAELDAMRASVEREPSDQDKIERLKAFAPYIGEPAVGDYIVETLKPMTALTQDGPLRNALSEMLKTYFKNFFLSGEAETVLYWRILRLADPHGEWQPGEDFGDAFVGNFMAGADEAAVARVVAKSFKGDPVLMARLFVRAVQRTVSKPGGNDLMRFFIFLESVQAYIEAAPPGSETRSALQRLINVRSVTWALLHSDRDGSRILADFARFAAQGMIEPRLVNSDILFESLKRENPVVVSRLVEWSALRSSGEAHSLLTQPSAVLAFLEEFDGRQAVSINSVEYDSELDAWPVQIQALTLADPRAADAIFSALEFFGSDPNDARPVRIYKLTRQLMSSPRSSEYAAAKTAAQTLGEALTAYVAVLEEQDSIEDIDYAADIKKMIEESFGAASGSRWAGVSKEALAVLEPKTAELLAAKNDVKKLEAIEHIARYAHEPGVADFVIEQLDAIESIKTDDGLRALYGGMLWRIEHVEKLSQDPAGEARVALYLRMLRIPSADAEWSGVPDKENTVIGGFLARASVEALGRVAKRSFAGDASVYAWYLSEMRSAWEEPSASEAIHLWVHLEELFRQRNAAPAGSEARQALDRLIEHPEYPGMVAPHMNESKSRATLRRFAEAIGGGHLDPRLADTAVLDAILMSPSQVETLNALIAWSEPQHPLSSDPAAVAAYLRALNRKFLTAGGAGAGQYDDAFMRWYDFVIELDGGYPSVSAAIQQALDFFGGERPVAIHRLMDMFARTPDPAARRRGVETFEEALNAYVSVLREQSSIQNVPYPSDIEKMIEESFGAASGSRVEQSDAFKTEVVRAKSFAEKMGAVERYAKAVDDPELIDFVEEWIDVQMHNMSDTDRDALTDAVKAVFENGPVTARKIGYYLRLLSSSRIFSVTSASEKTAAFLNAASKEQAAEVAAEFVDRRRQDPDLIERMAGAFMDFRPHLVPRGVVALWRYVRLIHFYSDKADPEARQAILKFFEPRYVNKLAFLREDDGFYELILKFVGALRSEELPASFANFHLVAAMIKLYESRISRVGEQTLQADLMMRMLSDFANAQDAVHPLQQNSAAIAGFLKNDGLGAQPIYDTQKKWRALVQRAAQQPRLADAMLDAAEFFGDDAYVDYALLGAVLEKSDPGNIAERVPVFIEALKAYVEALRDVPRENHPRYDRDVQRLVFEVFGDDADAQVSGSRTWRAFAEFVRNHPGFMLAMSGAALVGLGVGAGLTGFYAAGKMLFASGSFALTAATFAWIVGQEHHRKLKSEPDAMLRDAVKNLFRAIDALPVEKRRLALAHIAISMPDNILDTGSDVEAYPVGRIAGYWNEFTSSVEEFVRDFYPELINARFSAEEDDPAYDRFIRMLGNLHRLDRAAVQLIGLGLVPKSRLNAYIEARHASHVMFGAHLLLRLHHAANTAIELDMPERVRRIMSDYEIDSYLIGAYARGARAGRASLNLDPAIRASLSARDLALANRIVNENWSDRAALERFVIWTGGKVFADAQELDPSGLEDGEGRSIYLRLEKPIEAGGERIAILKFKGVRPRAKNGEVAAYFGNGYVAGPLEVGDDGRMRRVKNGGVPHGTMLWDRAKIEYEVMKSLRGSKVRTDYPAGLVWYRNLRYDGRRVGAVVSGLSEPDRRLAAFEPDDTDVYEPAGLAVYDVETGRYGGAQHDPLKTLRRYGRLLRAYHDAGFAHRYPHLGNIGILSNGALVLRDLDATVRIEGDLSGRARMRFLDVERAVYETINLDAHPKAPSTFAHGYWARERRAAGYGELLSEIESGPFLGRIVQLSYTRGDDREAETLELLRRIFPTDIDGLSAIELSVRPFIAAVRDGGYETSVPNPFARTIGALEAAEGSVRLAKPEPRSGAAQNAVQKADVPDAQAGSRVSIQKDLIELELEAAAALGAEPQKPLPADAGLDDHLRRIVGYFYAAADADAAKTHLGRFLPRLDAALKAMRKLGQASPERAWAFALPRAVDWVAAHSSPNMLQDDAGYVLLLHKLSMLSSEASLIRFGFFGPHLRAGTTMNIDKGDFAGMPMLIESFLRDEDLLRKMSARPGDADYPEARRAAMTFLSGLLFVPESNIGGSIAVVPDYFDGEMHGYARGEPRPRSAAEAREGSGRVTQAAAFARGIYERLLDGWTIRFEDQELPWRQTLARALELTEGQVVLDEPMNPFLTIQFERYTFNQIKSVVDYNAEHYDVPVAASDLYAIAASDADIARFQNVKALRRRLYARRNHEVYESLYGIAFQKAIAENFNHLRSIAAGSRVEASVEPEPARPFESGAAQAYLVEGLSFAGWASSAQEAAGDAAFTSVLTAIAAEPESPRNAPFAIEYASGTFVVATAGPKSGAGVEFALAGSDGKTFHYRAAGSPAAGASAPDAETEAWSAALSAWFNSLGKKSGVRRLTHRLDDYAGDPAVYREALRAIARMLERAAANAPELAIETRFTLGGQGIDVSSDPRSALARQYLGKTHARSFAPGAGPVSDLSRAELDAADAASKIGDAGFIFSEPPSYAAGEASVRNPLAALAIQIELADPSPVEEDGHLVRLWRLAASDATIGAHEIVRFKTADALAFARANASRFSLKSLRARLSQTLARFLRTLAETAVSA